MLGNRLFIGKLVMIIVLLWHAVFGLSGCANETEQLCGNNTKVMSIRGARLEPVFGTGGCTSEHRTATFGRVPALTYWLAPNEPVCVYWDALDIISTVPDKVNVTVNCELCTECEAKASDGSDSPRLRFAGPINAADIGPQVRLIQTQLPEMDLSTQVAAFGWRKGCVDNEGRPYPFYQPEGKSSNVRLHMEAWPCGSSDTSIGHIIGDKANFVWVPNISDGYAMPLQLLEENEDSNTTFVFNVGQEEEARWQDEFSTSLQISRIRILRGTYRKLHEPLPNVAGQPQKWRLVNPVPVAPKRIELDIHSSAYHYTCRGDNTARDGDYDITACRDKQDDQPVEQVLSATPRYGVLAGSVIDNLLWTVKFNSSGDFTLEPLGDGERLAIEFTLKVRE